MTLRGFLQRYLFVGVLVVALSVFAAAQAAVARGSMDEPDSPRSAPQAQAEPAQEEVDAILQDPATAGPALAAAAAEDPDGAGRAIAAAAAQDAQAAGNTLTAAVKVDAAAVADALKAAAQSDVAATMDALNMGLANDAEAIAALGEVLPVEIWLRPPIPDTGSAGGPIGGWLQEDGRSPVESVSGRFANPPERLRVRVTGLPLGVISTKPTPTPGTKSAFSERPFEMPAFPPEQSAHKLFRLTVGSGADSGFGSGYITFSVDKSWMDENGIHPWSVLLNRHNVDSGFWEFAPAQYVGEDETKVQYRQLVPEFSTWGITGRSTPPESEFKVENLRVNSPGARVPTEFTVQVTNLTSGPLTPLLGVYVGSVPAKTHRVLLEPNEQKDVVLTVRFEEGTYDIRVDRLTGSVNVGPEPPPTPTPIPSLETDEDASQQDDAGAPAQTAAADGEDGGLSTGLIVVIVIVVLLLVAVVGILALRRMAKQAG